MYRLWLSLVIYFLSVLPAYGQTTQCFTAASGNLVATQAASTDYTQNVGTTHRYWTSDADPSTDEAVVFHFYWPSSNPATATCRVDWRSASGISTNSVIFDCSGGCAGDGVEVDALVFGTAQSVTDAGKATPTEMNHTAESAAITFSNSAVNVYCGWKINRDADNVSDDLAVGSQILGGCLTWP